MTGPDTGGPPTGPGISTAQRVDNYRRQNGGGSLTTRQRRRVIKKMFRAGDGSAS